MRQTDISVPCKKDGGIPECGLGYCVVTDLVRDLQGKKYHISCDNFFTSVRLAPDLLDNELYLCGTMHSNRTDFPADLKPNKQEVRALRRGESVYRQQGNIVITVWKDKKLVSFISTQCDVRGNETVRRKQKDGTYIKVPTIPAVTLYNKYMGGVDRSDQMRQYYETLRRAKKMVVLLVLVLPGCNHCECTYSYTDCGQPPTFNPARVSDRTGKCTDRRVLFTSTQRMRRGRSNWTLASKNDQRQMQTLPKETEGNILQNGMRVVRIEDLLGLF